MLSVIKCIYNHLLCWICSQGGMIYIHWQPFFPIKDIVMTFSTAQKQEGGCKQKFRLQPDKQHIQNWKVYNISSIFMCIYVVWRLLCLHFVQPQSMWKSSAVSRFKCLHMHPVQLCVTQWQVAEWFSVVKHIHLTQIHYYDAYFYFCDNIHNLQASSKNYSSKITSRGKITITWSHWNALAVGFVFCLYRTEQSHLQLNSLRLLSVVIAPAESLM